jgi:competence protein ComEA
MKQGLKISLKENQLQGAVLVALSALVIPVVLFFCHQHFSSSPVIPFGNYFKGCIAVEVEGNIKEKGIYFFPKGQRLADLLNILRLPLNSIKGRSSTPDLEGPLPDGIKITLVQRKNERTLVEIGGMTASTRLALSRPLELNSASRDDLILVPGIGEKTAQKIIEARNREGKFRKLEELMKIKGIKQKRLEKLRPYLSVENL